MGLRGLRSFFLEHQFPFPSQLSCFSIKRNYLLAFPSIIIQVANSITGKLIPICRLYLGNSFVLAVVHLQTQMTDHLQLWNAVGINLRSPGSRLHRPTNQLIDHNQLMRRYREGSSSKSEEKGMVRVRHVQARVVASR